MTFTNNLDPSNSDIATFSPLRTFYTYPTARNCLPTNTQVSMALIQILQSSMVSLNMEEIKQDSTNCFLNAYTGTSTVFTNYAQLLYLNQSPIKGDLVILNSDLKFQGNTCACRSGNLFLRPLFKIDYAEAITVEGTVNITGTNITGSQTRLYEAVTLSTRPQIILGAFSTQIIVQDVNIANFTFAPTSATSLFYF